MDAETADLDGTHAALFPESEADVTVEDLINLPVDENGDTPSFSSLQKRCGQLIIATGTINGCLSRILLDTGFSAGLVMDPRAAERCGVKPKKRGSATLSTSVTVGDGRKISARVAPRTPLNLGGFECRQDALIMPLGDKFDAAVGMDYFEHLQVASGKPLEIDFIDKGIAFCVKGRRFRISSTEVPASFHDAPTSCAMYLRSQLHDSRREPQLPVGTRVLRFDQHLRLVRTKEGDDYLPHCDPALGRGTAFGGGEESRESKNFFDNPDSVSFSAVDADDLDGSQMVEKAVQAQNKLDLLAPVPNPDWKPTFPADDDDFTDDAFLERVNVRQNTLEKLQALEQEHGVEFVKVLKRNGQVFRDEVPTRMVPDRGPWNGNLEFVNPADSLKPICKKPYRLSPDETRAAAENLRDLLLRGTIRPSSSPWGTPIFLVPKADGGWRMACDYRDLNSKLVKEAYTPPAADQLFDQLVSAKFFSSHDCTWGYHQLRWNQDAIPKTAIRTHLGTFEFLVVNFGSTSAPAQWTRLIEAIIRPYIGKFVMVFLDDLCVYSDSAEEHARHLDLVYRLLAKNSIFLRFGKCYFFTQKFKFLGWIIGNGTLSADPEKLGTLKEWPIPTSKREVRSFTGFCNFYKRLIPNYSQRISPLHDLQRDEVPDSPEAFQKNGWWTDAHTESFRDLIQALTTAPAVSIVNPQCQFELEVDASEAAVGGILYQVDPETKKKTVVEYYSRRLSSAQRNYPPGKLELLALIVSLEHWRHYLKGAKFKVVIHTDHEPLTSIRTTKNPQRMLLRWLNFIEQFNLDVRYKKGAENPADFLSRPTSSTSASVSDSDGIQVQDVDNAPDDEPPDLGHMGALYQDLNVFSWLAESLRPTLAFYAASEDFLQPDISTEGLDHLKSATASDPLAKKVLEKPRDFSDRMRLVDGLLWWVQSNGDALFIPSACQSIRKAIFAQHHAHITGGHFGARKTVKRIQQNYWWPGMNQDVASWARECSTCLTSKRKLLPPSSMSAHHVPHKPWEVVFMDEVSGFPASNGFDAIWIFMDKLSKMVHFAPVVKLGLDAVGLAKLYMRHVFRLHGLPRVIVSDRDARYDELWRALFKAAGVRLNMSTPMHPRTDSSGEAAVKICVDLCRHFVNSNRDDWFDLLPALEFAYNSTPGSSGFSPFEINGLQRPRSAQSALIEATAREHADAGRDPPGAKLLGRFAHVISIARHALARRAEAVEAEPRPVLPRVRSEEFQIGDRVFLKRGQAGVTFPQDKMSRLYVGPFEVEERAGDKAYRLKLPPSMRVSPVQNVDNLWKPPANVHLPPMGDPAAERAPDEPLPRLTEGPLVINNVVFETHDDGVYEVYAETAVGKFSLHELCIHQHYEECLEALWDRADVIRRWPYCLGRPATHINWDHPVFVSAFDPSDADRAFQLECVDPRDSYWAARTEFAIKRKRPLPQEQAHMLPSFNSRAFRRRRRSGRPLRVLEICAGKGCSFSRVVRRMFPNAEIITLDISDKAQPDIVADVTTWRYLDHFEPGYFDIIWASPPCTEYSPAKTTAQRDLRKADAIVQAVLRIFIEARPLVWLLENPHTMLHKRPFMAIYEHLRRACTYCKYRFPYKKPTDIWCNISLPQLLHCDIEHCRQRLTLGRHNWTAQSGPSGWNHTPGVPTAVADFVPPRLIRVLLGAAREFISSVEPKRVTWT